VTAPPKKQVRLTFLWADEAAVVQDFNAKYSEKLVEWANAFFGKHGFELEVKPAPGGKAAHAYRYCLDKSDGLEPDIASAEEFWTRLLNLKKPTLREWLKTYDEIEALQERHKNKQQEIATETGRFATLPVAQWGAIVTRLTTLFDELRAITDQLVAKQTRYAELDLKLDQINRQHQKQADLRDFDVPARSKIGAKLLRSFDLSLLTKIKTGNENTDVVDDSRLKIVFCRFRLAPSVMVLRPGPQPYGVTLDRTGANSVNGQYLWDGVYILINLNKQEQITLAHEVVHAAGRHHIPDVKRLKDIRSWIRTITSDPVTGKIELPPIYEKAAGGYYDGPEDDIINYNSKGKKPDEVKLYPDDVKRMEDAFFVKDAQP
jgi:hypothetical protein